MSRRQRDTGEQFSLAELAIGGGMTKRAVQFVSDLGLLPSTGIRAMKRIGSIGAFVAAGTPLLVAARLAGAILDEFNQYDGEAPSGLSHLARELPSTEIKALPAEASDYWYHRALSRHPNIYQPGTALRSDALIEIVDRRLVFSGSRSGLRALTPAGSFEATFVGWIEGWERGAAARVVPVYEQIQISDNGDRVDEWNAIAARHELEAQHARENALGKLTVNVSLAIRTALDRVAAHRAPSTKAAAT